MASLDALSKTYKQPGRSALIRSMKYQKDPVVQIALIQLLVQMKKNPYWGFANHDHPTGIAESHVKDEDL